jgi:hypothetical protein
MSETGSYSLILLSTTMKNKKNQNLLLPNKDTHVREPKKREREKKIESVILAFCASIFIISSVVSEWLSVLSVSVCAHKYFLHIAVERNSIEQWLGNIYIVCTLLTPLFHFQSVSNADIYAFNNMKVARKQQKFLCAYMWNTDGKRERERKREKEKNGMLYELIN